MKRFVSLILSVCFLFSINTVSYAANMFFVRQSPEAANIVWTFKHFWQIGNRATRVAG